MSMLEKLTAQHSFCRSQLQLYEEHLRRDVSAALGGFGMMIPQLLEDWKFKDDQTYCLLRTRIIEPYNKCSIYLEMFFDNMHAFYVWNIETLARAVYCSHDLCFNFNTKVV